MGEMLMPVKMSWQRLRQMILHREGGGRGPDEGGRTDEEQAAFALLQVVPAGCQASSSRGSDKKSGNKRSPRLISLGSSGDDLESDGEMNK